MKKYSISFIVSALVVTGIIALPSLASAQIIKLAQTTTLQTQASTPVIHGVSSPTVLSVNETGAWTVNASDPQNGNLTYTVNWGDEGFRLLTLFSEPEAFVQSSTFTHSYSRSGVYKVTFTVKNDAGFTAQSSATVYVRNNETNTALTVSRVEVNSVKEHQTTISWLTNERSDSTIWYSTSSPVVVGSAASLTEKNLATNHRIRLSDLKSNTTYYAIVESKNSSGIATSTQINFTTLPDKKQTPGLRVIEGPRNLEIQEQGTWTVQASDPENSSLSYSVDWGDQVTAAQSATKISADVFTQTSTFSHVYTNEGTYTITFTVKNELGLTATSKVKIKVGDDNNNDRPNRGRFWNWTDRWNNRGDRN